MKKIPTAVLFSIDSRNWSATYLLFRSVVRRFFGFTPGVGYTLFSHPMGNHTREAWSAQANSQIGGTIGDSRNERVLTWQQPPRTTTPRASE
jgi:hypothetical protein